LELVTGAMIIVWLSQLIDKKGIGNGTSLIIFTNIVMTLLNKNFFAIFNQNSFFLFEIGFLFFLFFLICISQITRIQVEVVSARQLAFLEKIEKNTFTNKVSKNFQFQENGLSIRLNQAGIFPIIIASNLLPFFSFLPFLQEKSISSLFYYCLIICFNYFYTIVFWDPEKIAEQLRKASVSIVNVTPGAETISYLGNMVKASSILGGLFLCLILFLFDFVKQVSNSPFLNQFQISSLIILVGVAYELQKTVRSLYKNVIE
jgi:preprotein translocase subunit SecY